MAFGAVARYTWIVVLSRSSSRVVAWTAVVLQGFATLVLHGIILCVGPGDHVALELTSANNCCPPRSAMATVGDRDCCDCTDASLLQPMVERRPGAEIFAAGMLLSLSEPVTSAENRYRRLPVARSLAPPGYLGARRAVVLLV